MPKIRAKRLKEIKSIYVVRDRTENSAGKFDALVNEYLANGWRLAKTQIIEAQGNNVNDVFYALLEKWEV